ncbi:hypothetical protein ACFLRI_03880 [Bacteroidota bacterium]
MLFIVFMLKNFYTRIFLLFLTVIVAHSCKESLTGELKPNLAPETYTVVDTIMRYGPDRFKTEIQINWWGEDPDGYVKGFEYSTDKMNWTFTNLQDSTFLVNIPPGQDTFDFSFYVRAIDNHGLKDMTPAYIVYPVKNSPPSVEFDYSIGNPKRKPEFTFPVLKFSWIGQDPDGAENIQFYEIFLNDTSSNPVIIEAVFNSVILEATDLQQGVVDCRVFQGNSLTPHTNLIQGLKLNDTNQFLIRAVDVVGEKSPIVESYKIYVRKPIETTSKEKVLLVNAYSSSIVTRESFYTNYLNAIGIFDFNSTRIQEVSGDHYTELAPDNITQSMIFNLFDVIIWFGKDIDFSMSLAQRTTDDFFNKGGRMFMAVEIASSISDQAGYLDFSPIDSLVSLPADALAFRIEKAADVIPAQSGWPQLKTDPAKFIPSARPFYEDFSSTSLYDAMIIKSTASGSEVWQGKSTIMAKRMKAGKTTFIISSLELHNLNGSNNMSELFTKLFIDELGL